MSDRSRASAYGQPPLCDVCEHSLSPRGQRRTGLCIECRRAGAAFARRWMRDLATAGTGYREIAEIVGTTYKAVCSRLSEMRRGYVA